MIKNIILLGILALLALIMYQCSVSDSEIMTSKKNNDGSYFFIYNGNRVWLNESVREGSLSGHYRSGGPHSGK